MRLVALAALALATSASGSPPLSYHSMIITIESTAGDRRITTVGDVVQTYPDGVLHVHFRLDDTVFANGFDPP